MECFLALQEFWSDVEKDMGKCRVLLVEDEVIISRTLIGCLKEIGYTVTAIVSSGKQAIAKAIETSPDMILMDIYIKGDIDGVTTAAQVRQLLNIPVVFLTAFGDDTTIERAKLSQPYGYILKPFNKDDLRVAIEMGLYQHKMEQALQESQEQLATILRSMNDAVIATDQQGRISFINPAAEAMTGWYLLEVVGKDVSEIFQLFDETTGSATPNSALQVLQGQLVVHQEDYSVLIARDGSRIPVGHNASPLKEKSGQVNGAVIVFWDVSERRQTKILEQALVKEQELSSFRSQFISTVSHEFRNPLSAILTATELLDRYGDRATKEQKQRYLERIKASVDRMTELMEDVLLIGQAESGKLEFSPGPLHVEKFCRDLIEEVSVGQNNSQIIFFSGVGDCKEVCLDERLLRYILANLLLNAIKYSPKGGNIKFSLKIDTKKKVVIFSIRDQGIGISPEDQAKLFESFYRGKNVSTIPGTGLGLAIVKRCVERHRGRIGVTSKVGVGTNFVIRLPIS
ncbi:MAG: ATP-binding protein [Coleofasciculaceae cyanobacterium]